MWIDELLVETCDEKAYKYDYNDLIGEGAFGVVYKAFSIVDQEI